MSHEPGHGLIAELRRRNLYRVALAYLVAAWLLVQVAATVFPYLGLPDSAVTLVIAIAGIGFIPALVFAWAFEVTPDGLKRERDIHRSEVDISDSARRLDVVIIVMLAAAIGLYGYDRFNGPRPVTTAPREAGRASIAVLPFENRSASVDDAFFVDGIHDDILTSLANIGSMKVISRTSVEQFENTQLTMPEIGEILGVSSILEGGVQRAGDRIRINVQLIDAATDEHLWAETYNRQLTVENVFAIQSEIATVIANELRAALTPREEDRLAVVPTNNIDAYEAYMLGRQRLAHRTEASVQDAIDYFGEAVAKDPRFALAYVGLADSYALSSGYANRSWDELETLARAAVESALELDPGLGEAYTSLAYIEMESDNLERAEEMYKTAISLSPNYATVYQWYGELLNRSNRLPEAFEQVQIAKSIDPLSPIINYTLGRQQNQLGMLQAAEDSFKKAIEIDPAFGRGYEGLAILLFSNTGPLDDAAIAQRHAIRLGAVNVANFALMANIFVSLGDMERAQYWLDEAAARDANNPNVMLVSISLSLFRSEVASASQMARQALESNPRGLLFTYAATLDYLLAGDFDNARAVVRNEFPELLDDRGRVVDETNYVTALQVAAIERLAGNLDEAAMLIRSVEAASEAKPITNPTFAAIFNMQLAALRGQNAIAIGILRDLVESGWTRFAFFYIDYDPVLDSLRDDPGFQAVRALWQTKLAEYRESLARKWADAGFD